MTRRVDHLVAALTVQFPSYRGFSRLINSGQKHVRATSINGHRPGRRVGGQKSRRWVAPLTLHRSEWSMPSGPTQINSKGDDATIRSFKSCIYDHK